MRDLCVWAAALVLLGAAMFTVSVRREVYAGARRIGALEESLRELKRRNDNLALQRECLASPGALLAKVEEAGLAEAGR
jgi:hypothetical protein